MKRINMILIIFLGVFITFGIITLVGLGFSAGNEYISGNHKEKGARAMKIYTEEIKVDGINSIKIENTNLNIKLLNSNDDTLYVELSSRRRESSQAPAPLKVTQEGSTIHISANYTRPGFFSLFTMKEQTLYVKIPAAYTGDLEMIKIGGNLTTEFNLTNKFNKCQFSDCKGNIKFNASDIKSLIGEKISGNITVQSNISEVLKIKQTQGNCKIFGISDKGCVVEIDNILGNLKLNYAYPAKTTITNSRGNIGIIFENNDDILLMTEKVLGNVSGNYSMSRKGVDFMIKDVMGNVRISSKK